MKFNQIVARDFLHASRRSRAGEGTAVGVGWTVDKAGENTQRHSDGFVLLLLDGVQLQFLLALEIGVRKRRIQNHVAEQLERGIQLFL